MMEPKLFTKFTSSAGMTYDSEGNVRTIIKAG
jgi:hypothetical protein